MLLAVRGGQELFAFRKQTMADFTFSTRIRFIDTDASGRIHYTAMFRYFETAEIEFLRALDIAYDPHARFAFPRAHVECNYRLALEYDDVIDIEVRLAKVGTSSVRFEFRARKDGRVAADGAVIAVCMDRITGKAVPLPGDLRKKLSITVSDLF